MAKEISQVAQSLLILLNNVEELIVRSNNRENARGVMKAFASYAKGKNYPFPTEKVHNFHAILLDGRPETISFLVKDIANDIIVSDSNK